MDEPQHANAGDDARRPWQFSLRALLMTPVGVAIAMSFFIAWYPFSKMTLPCFGVVLVCVFVWKTLWTKELRAAETLVVAFLVYVLATHMLSINDHSEVSRRWQCSHNLRQIVLALHNYHDRYGCFPPAYLADANGRPMHSWRVLILPYMEQQALYAKYRFDEPWNGPNNSKLAGEVVFPYTCPEQGAASGQTSYLAVVGPGTAWPGATSAKFSDLRQGTSNTAIVVEVANSGIHWMEPRDLDVAAMPMTVNPKDGLGISSLHRDPGWKRTPLGAQVAMADGSARFLPSDTPEAEVRALIAPTPPASKSTDASQGTK